MILPAWSTSLALPDFISERALWAFTSFNTLYRLFFSIRGLANPFSLLGCQSLPIPLKILGLDKPSAFLHPSYVPLCYVVSTPVSMDAISPRLSTADAEEIAGYLLPLISASASKQCNALSLVVVSFFPVFFGSRDN